MKHLILINGTMGAGKTAVSNELSLILKDNVLLEGDWAWKMNPFVVNDETKEMVMDNICFLLNSYIKCSIYENIIFCWVMHEQWIIDRILSHLNLRDVNMYLFTLMPDKEALIKWIQKDINQGARKPDIIKRSIEYLEKYDKIESIKIDVSKHTPKQTAKIIAKQIYQIHEV
ncbi:MAG: AAA family ATPase [Clostridia bacterium]|jgi:broad-specificity NMP kinase